MIVTYVNFVTKYGGDIHQRWLEGWGHIEAWVVEMMSFLLLHCHSICISLSIHHKDSCNMYNNYLLINYNSELELPRS